MKDSDIKDSNIYTVEEAMPFLQLGRSQVSTLCRKFDVKKTLNRYQISGNTLLAMKHRKKQTAKAYDLKDFIYEINDSTENL